MLTKVATWLLNRNRKKIIKKQKQSYDEQAIKFNQNMEQLRRFVSFLQKKGFSNRKQRKLFWQRVSKGEPVLENTIRDMMNRYGVNTNKVKVTKKEK